MCVHIQVEPSTDEIEWIRAAFEGVENPPDLQTMKEHVWPKYPARVVTQRGQTRAIEVMRWGIWPFYAKEKAQYLHNARNDGLLTKATWKNSARLRRCLVPAVAYFEPGLGPPKARGEVRFTLAGRRRFFIAGLWDTDPDGSGTRAFTLVTTTPNTVAARYHDRMPVVLADVDARAWLGDQPLPDAQLAELCRGADASLLQPEELPAGAGKITKTDLFELKGE